MSRGRPPAPSLSSAVVVEGFGGFRGLGFRGLGFVGPEFG